MARRLKIILVAALFCASAVLFCARPGLAFWGAEGESYWFDLGASIREVGAGFQYYDEPQLFGEGNEFDGLSQTILRLTLDGGFFQRHAFEAHLVSDLTWTTAPGGFVSIGAVGGLAAKRYRIADASWKWFDNDNWEGNLFFDRLNFKITLPNIDVTAGRQAVNFSQAYFWNPLDVFLPFDPEAFDRDYKPGVDALRVDFDLGQYSSLTLVAAPGREIKVDLSEEGPELSAEGFADEPWYGSALLARVRTNLRDWDLTMQGGKIYGGWQIGAGFSGEIWELGVRGETTWFSPIGERKVSYDNGEDEIKILTKHAAAVVGVDHRFENDFHFNIEYLYNGAGGDDLFAGMIRSAVGETLSLSKHLLGTELSYQFHPLFSGHLSWIQSLSDYSSMLSPTFSYSVSNESDLVFGAIFGIGDRPESTSGEGFDSLELESEFGTYPNILFAELKYYF